MKGKKRARVYKVTPEIQESLIQALVQLLISPIIFG